MLIHRPTALHLIRPYYAIWHLIHTFHKVKKNKKKTSKTPAEFVHTDEGAHFVVHLRCLVASLAKRRGTVCC